jgi:hypothetical protein
MQRHRLRWRDILEQYSRLGGGGPAGEPAADSWQPEQRIKHAENQLAVLGR